MSERAMLGRAPTHRIPHRRNRLAVLIFAAGSAAACWTALHVPTTQEIAPHKPVAASGEVLVPPANDPSPPLPRPAYDQRRASDTELDDSQTNQRRREIEAQISVLTARLLDNEVARQALEARLASNTKRPPVPAGPPANSAGEARTTSESALQQIALLKIEEHALAAKMQDNHPRLAAVRQKIEDANRAQNSGKNEEFSQRPAPAPAEQLRESLAEKDRHQLDELRRGELQLIENRGQLRGALAALDAQELAATELAPPDTSRQMIVDVPADEAPPPAAAVSAAAASVSTSPAFPGIRRLITLALGLALALAAARAAAALAKARNPLVASAAHLEALWDLPLIGIGRPLPAAFGGPASQPRG